MPLDADPFTLTPRQRDEVARIFGQSLEEIEQPHGAVQRIEETVRQYLSPSFGHDDHGDDELPNADPVSMQKHRKRARKMIATIDLLRGQIEEAARADENVIDNLDFRSNIVGALALAGPIKRKRVPFGEDDRAELIAFLQSGEFALDAIGQNLDHLSAASQLWLNYTMKPRGGGKAPHNQLILTLYQICYPWTLSELEPPESPTSTNSRLARLFGLVMEALDKKPPSNIEQAISRALAYEQDEEAASNRWFDEVQGFGNQQ